MRPSSNPSPAGSALRRHALGVGVGVDDARLYIPGRRWCLFALSFVAFPLLLTQSFNRLRSASLLSLHAQLGWVWIARNRWDQCIAESLVVAALVMAMAAAIIALNAHVLRSGPFLPLDDRSWRAVLAEEDSERAAMSDEERKERRHEAAWQCLTLLAALLLLLTALRYMATVSAAQALPLTAAPPPTQRTAGLRSPPSPSPLPLFASVCALSKWPAYRHGNHWWAG